MISKDGNYFVWSITDQECVVYKSNNFDINLIMLQNNAHLQPDFNKQYFMVYL